MAKYPDCRAIITDVERKHDEETAILAASHMLDTAIEYLIERRGAVYMLDEFTNSVATSDALATEMERKRQVQ